MVSLVPPIWTWNCVPTIKNIRALEGHEEMAWFLNCFVDVAQRLRVRECAAGLADNTGETPLPSANEGHLGSSRGIAELTI